MEPTIIGPGTKIDNLVMIAHNVVTGEGCLLVAQAGISGSAKLGNRVTIAAKAGVLGHLLIGDDVTVGAKSGVTKDLEPGEAYLGSPAIPFLKSRKLYALYNMLPRFREDIKDLKKRIKALEKDA